MACALLAVLALLSTPLSTGVAHAAEPAQPEFVAELLDAQELLDEAGHGWLMTLRLVTTRPIDPTSIYAFASTTADEQLVVDASAVESDGVVQLVVPAVEDGSEPGEWLIVRVRAAFGVSVWDATGDTLYLRRDEDTLVQGSAGEHLESLLDDDGALEPHGTPSFGSPEYDHLPPWEHPEFPAHYRELLAEVLMAKDVAVQEGAIRASGPAPAPPATSTPAAGCATGSAPTSYALVLVLLAFGTLAIRRRPAAAVVLLISVGVAAPTIAEAQTPRVVAGFVSFWDTRDAMSDLTGSRLPTCDTSDTSCGPGYGPSCCYRPIPHATVVVKQFGVELDTWECDANGFFLLQFTGSDPNTFEFYIRYHRDGDPALTRLTTDFYSHGFSAPPFEQRVLKTALSQQFLPLPNLPVNAAYDTTSHQGNVASVWTTVTQAQQAIADEGDTSYRRVHGAAPTDPDDLTLIRYTGYKTEFTDCDNSVFNTYDTISRWVLPAVLEGFIYEGRVVGCSGSTVGHYNLPAFPPVPHSNTSMPYFGSETVAAALAFPRLVGMLSRWDPDTAALSDIKSVLGMPCEANALTNSNQAASIRNSTLALWELIDTDTAGSTGTPDTCDLNMAQLMTGLALHSTVAGSPGQNHTKDEPIFTEVAGPGCASGRNQDCAAGDVCLKNASGYRCHTGDPHGANVYDITVWTGFAALLGGWSGCSDIVASLDSSVCFTTPDDTFWHEGSYRTD